MTDERVPELTPEQKRIVAWFEGPDIELTSQQLAMVGGAPTVDGGSQVTGDDLSVSDRRDAWLDEMTWDEAVEQPSTVSCEVFMADHGLSRTGFRELLREYRSETGWSAFEWGERDVLDSQFLSWFEWERI